MILDGLASGDCIPFIIGDGPSHSGPRIGGAPPEGIRSIQSDEAHYLLTMLLEADGTTEVSIFLCPDWDDVLFSHSRMLHSQDEAWVEFVVHGSSVRSLGETYDSILTPHPLLFLSLERDRQGDNAEVDDESGAPLRRHKLGGQPYFVRYKEELVKAIQEIEQQGYRQLLQLTFPSPKDGDIDGDWPFADGQFYLFFKVEGGLYHWYYGWLY